MLSRDVHPQPLSHESLPSSCSESSSKVFGLDDIGHSIPLYFEQRRRAHPDRVAVRAADCQYSYAELDERASRVAASILEQCQAGDDSVILLMDRCPEMIIGLLGILKSGKVCVPLLARDDPSRIEAVYHAQRTPVVVTTQRSLMQASLAIGQFDRVLNVDTPEVHAKPLTTEPCQSPDDLALVIYTSGSTGLPKGVMHTHRSILQNIAWFAQTFETGPADRSILLSSCAHIAGIIGTLRPLLTGGSIDQFNILDEGFDALAVRLRDRQITIMPIVPTMYRHFVHSLSDELQFPDLRLIILSGESSSAADVRSFQRHFSDDCVLVNILGCTELPMFRCLQITKETEISGTKVPAGHAIPGREVFLLDGDGAAVPEGEQGEIVVSSPYLALGYWESPKETRERFFVSASGARCYRTGDVGRILPGDLLVHEGRLDWQLNRQGVRMEPEEIERAILEKEGVVAAAVRSWDVDGGEPILCAYIVIHRDDVTLEQIKEELSKRLPVYMMPSRFQLLASLPLNRSGKIDRSALPRPLTEDPDRSLPSELPQNAVEREVAKICAGVMGLPVIGRNENLMELGLNSILAIQITNRLNSYYNIVLPMSLPLQHPTMCELATAILQSAEVVSETNPA